MSDPYLDDETWQAARDDSLPRGAVEINGHRLMLDDLPPGFGLSDLTPWQRRILAAALDGDWNPVARVPYHSGRHYLDALVSLAAEHTYHRAAASRCTRADECVLDPDCPFAADCLLAEAQ